MWQLLGVLALNLIVLLLDAFTPVGIADMMFYFVPLALTALQKRPSLPIAAAVLASMFIVVGYFISPVGEAAEVGQVNRGMALLILWGIAPLVRQFISSRNETTRQTWLKTAQSDVAARVRGELAVEELGERVLTYLAERVNAQVGVLYVRPNGAAELERVAGYAVSADDAPTRRRFGEGLVGQAAAEHRTLTVTDLPAGYLKVSSGLGSAPSQRLVVAPFSTDGEAKAVVELGFLGQAHPQTEELLECVAEMVGTAIRSAQHKRRLSELLAESQQQAEELQAQQEEMAVLNEELEQHNKAMKESQVRLENQQAELEQTNQQLEEQTLSLERQKAALIEAQKRLKEKSDEVAQSSRYKSEFLANMSHELRTPLNSALILSKLLAENRAGNLNEEQIKYAETIHTAGSDLLNLINDVLDLSKVEAGKLEVRPEPFTLAHLLASLERTFQPIARDKGLSFQVAVDAGVPSELTSDRQRLEQILKNFLANAFKFTDKGSVTLRVHGEPGGIAIAVQDSGIGIAKDQQAAIFEAFKQADGTANRKFGGTGLGLSISRQLAQLLGGDIAVSSEPGRGSTFTLRLPIEQHAEAPGSVRRELATAEASAPAPTAAAEPIQQARFSFADDRERLSEEDRKILIIEDDESFAKILFDLAREMGFQSLVAPTAAEGTALVQEYLPSAIVLDIRLPDHNGLAILEQLKSDPRTRHIPVHVVSADDFAGTARRLGAIGYLLKPVKREQLVTAFHELEQRIEQKLKRMLVVEDDEIQRESIVRLIGGQDVKIDAVATAEEALERLAEVTYDCMVMDLTLPDMSGYELLAQLSRADSEYSYPPVIVYTGRDLDRREEEQLRRYSSSIIVKGARSPERLLSEVTLFLHRVETELPPERQKMLRELRSREQVLDGAKILVVDDDARNIFALSSALEPHGARVVIARNGRESLQKLGAEPDIDLVLMDIMMPEMNGFEAMQAIREQKRFQKLPIIALTAKAMRDDQENCLRAGANDYLAKPVDLDKLLSLLRVWLSSRKGF